jgi:cobalamin synthase
MVDWWGNFGRDSLIAGVLAGLIVALVLLWQRWYAVRKGNPSPARHGLLFMLDLVKTTSFFTLALTLSAMAAERIIPKSLMWFLVVLMAVAMIAAVLLGQFAKDRFGPDDMTETAPRSEPETPAP